MSSPPKAVAITGLVRKAVELEVNYSRGILPLAGGWYDQDPLDIQLIKLASQARAEREGINQQKSARKSSRPTRRTR